MSAASLKANFLGQVMRILKGCCLEVCMLVCKLVCNLLCSRLSYPRNKTPELIKKAVLGAGSRRHRHCEQEGQALTGCMYSGRLLTQVSAKIDLAEALAMRQHLENSLRLKIFTVIPSDIVDKMMTKTTTPFVFVCVIASK